MKRVVFQHFGKPAEILHVEESQPLSPGPDEVLIRVIASPINPSDIMFVQNLYGIRPQLPSGAGFGGACGLIRSNAQNLTNVS